MKWVMCIAMSCIVASCTPVSESEQYKTKYPDAPTMQSAEDATSGTLF